jgi:lipopolysaccharide export system permease protein
MLIIDRYITRLFLKILLVAGMGMVGLYVIIDVVGKLDDLTAQGASQGSVRSILLEFYGARILMLFDNISAPLALIAGVSTLAWMRHRNELTAIQATGTGPLRVMKPLVFAAIGVSLLALCNRELLIPRFHDRLTRSAHNWDGTKKEPFRPQHDESTNILIGGRWTFRADRQIVEPIFRLHQPIGQFNRPIVARLASWLPADGDHPAGYLLDDVTKPRNINECDSVFRDRDPVILTPSDTPWLTANQCFVVSEVDFDRLTSAGTSYQYQSSRQLIRNLASGRLDYRSVMRVILHSRIVRPLLDMTLFLMGISLVLSQRNRDVFVAAGLCGGVVALFYGVTLVCQAMGNNGYLLSPVMAAWIPLLVFAPCAFSMTLSLRD